MMVYLSADSVLRTIPWESDRPAFNVVRIADLDWTIGEIKHFTKPHRYYLGSYQHCGCGFHSLSDDGRRCMSALRDFLQEANRETRGIEIWACWAGNESADIFERVRLSPDSVIDPGFRFEEETFYMIETAE